MKRRGFLALPLGLALPVRAADYAVVRRETQLVFPRDHGAHPAQRTEWWYVTGWVRTRDGRDLGVQVTFFRHRPGIAEDVASRFAARQLIFAHAAIADPALGRLRHDQRVARAAFDLAGTAEETTRVWIDDWSLALDGGDRYVVRLTAREFIFALEFAATQPLLLQGEQGFSRKGPEPAQASHYYSRPHLRVSGNVTVGKHAIDVSGNAWLDHEWSSEYMAKGAVGWDWIGINLDDGGALMAFRMRDASDGTVWAGGTSRDREGRVRTFARDEVGFVRRRTWQSPRTSVVYPVAMDVRTPSGNFAITPLMDDQELDSRVSTGTLYWEGAVELSRDGKRVGRGYLELTGYGGALKI
ncbi:MAG TPA: carotenoid 1,2-hydratase [Casimicrobiaceae bacterium]|nr:carotenoid 1,2-hydratase [Casimicrobiaceae bacterium]